MRVIYTESVDDLHDVVLAEIAQHDPQMADQMRGHPAYRPLIADAWANGWRDAAWLAGCALLGTAHPDTRDSTALAMCNLMQAADVVDPDPDVPPVGEGRP